MVILRRSSFVIASALTLGALGVAERPACGDEPGRKTLHAGVSAQVDAVYLRQLPALQMDSPIQTSSGAVDLGDLPRTGHAAFVGAGFDTAFRIGERWIVPVFGAQRAVAVDGNGRGFRTKDGNFVELHALTATYSSFL